MKEGSTNSSTSQGYSSSSASTNSSTFVKELKSDFSIKKVPRIIEIFQKLFVIYFLIFIGITSVIMFIAYTANVDYFEDIRNIKNSK